MSYSPLYSTASGMGFENDDPTYAQEQKVWLNLGNSGIAMASGNEKFVPHDQSHEHPQQQGTPPPAQPDHSGLQVVESGLEVAGSDQSEVLSAGSSPYHSSQLPQQQSPFGQASPVRYAEQKGYGWDGAPPPQVVPIEQTGMGGYPRAPNRLHSASTGTSQQHQYLGGHNPFDPAAGKPQKARICGLKKVVFWGILGAVIFIVVLALAVGLGVGLASRNSSSSDASASASSTSSSFATATLPAATATATATSNTNILCPTANQTVYQIDTAADKKFLVLCGRDYNSNSGAFDISSMNITTFEGCLNQCGNTDGCVAVGYGIYYGTNTCWLKSGIGEPNWSADWYAAVELNSV